MGLDSPARDSNTECNQPKWYIQLLWVFYIKICFKDTKFIPIIFQLGCK